MAYLPISDRRFVPLPGGSMIVSSSSSASIDGGVMREPDQISGLVGWYDSTYPDTLWADTTGTTPATIGGAVARWDDKSGGARHVTQGTLSRRPTRQSDHVSFDGTGDQLFRTAVSTTSLQYTSVCVVTTNNASGTRYVFANGSVDTSPANGYGLIQLNSNRSIGHFQAVSPEDGALVLNTREIWIGRTGTANSFRLNGVSQTLSATNSVPLTPTTRFQIGGRNATDRNWSGQISAVLLYNRELTVAECQLLEEWLSSRHGVAL